MKILIVHYRFFVSGGPERYLFNVKDALERRGHEVIPFSITNCNNESSKYQPYFAPNIGNSNEVLLDKYPKTARTYWDLFTREFYSFSVKKKLKKLIKETKPDVCYLLAYKRALSPSVIDACFEMNIPIINRLSDYNMVCGAASLYCHGQYCEKCVTDSSFNCVKNRCIKNSFFYSITRFFSEILFIAKRYDRKVCRYICTNAFMRDIMEKKGFCSKKMVVLPTFFREGDYSKKLRTENALEDKIKFLFIGNIDESKGIYDLLQALHCLKQTCQNFHLYIVGGLRDYENDRVKSVIDELDLSTYITMVPFQKKGNIYEYYELVNLTIIPSRWVENLPNTLIESLYFNRPVVVPNWGSYKYTVVDSVSFKFEALSVQSLSKTLENICKNASVIIEKSKACSSFFEDNYAEITHLEGLEKIFKECVTK